MDGTLARLALKDGFNLYKVGSRCVTVDARLAVLPQELTHRNEFGLVELISGVLKSDPVNTCISSSLPATAASSEYEDHSPRSCHPRYFPHNQKLRSVSKMTYTSHQVGTQP